MREWPIVGGLFLGPNCLHSFHTVDHDAEAIIKRSTMVLNLLLVPSRTYAELKPSAGKHIQAGYSFGRHDRVALAYQANSGTDAKRPGRYGSCRQDDKRIKSVRILLGQWFTAGKWRSPTHWNMCVLWDKQRLKAPVFQRSGKIDDGD